MYVSYVCTAHTHVSHSHVVVVAGMILLAPTTPLRFGVYWFMLILVSAQVDVVVLVLLGYRHLLVVVLLKVVLLVLMLVLMLTLVLVLMLALLVLVLVLVLQRNGIVGVVVVHWVMMGAWWLVLVGCCGMLVVVLRVSVLLFARIFNPVF